MPKGLLFWILFVLAAVVGLYWGYSSWGWGAFGGSLILFLLIGLLGWGIYGAPIK